MFDEELWVYAKGDLKIPLSYKEGKVLQMLIENKNTTVTFKEFSHVLYGCEEDKWTRKAIGQFVSKLRKKIGNDGEIVSLLDIGYRLE